MHKIYFSILARHWLSHQRWLTFQQVFLISTFVKNNVTAYWVANETDIPVIVTTHKCSLWRPQFHTTVPQCGDLHCSHYISQERRCVQSRLQLFTSFISSACIFREMCADENSVVPTVPAAALDTLSILSFLQSERQNPMWEEAFTENPSECLWCHQLMDS